jgi:Transposase IS66 family
LRCQWVAVTPLIICFQVILSRASTAAQTVLGSTFAGFITSDRCAAYNWVTVRTCRNLLKLEVALWLFVREDGVEPTNNAAERAIRPAVIWRMQSRRGSLGVRCTKQRRTSFGSDSLAGSQFVSRLLTVVSSLNLQERNILDFLVESISVARAGEMPPSLLR